MAANLENRSLYPQGLKHCSKCKTIKSLSEFSKKKSTWDGLRSTCKVCDKVDHSQYRSRSENQQKERAYKETWNEKNREHNRIVRSEREKRNKERKKEKRRAWHLAHKESENAKARKKMREWVQNNPDRHRRNGRNYRARSASAKGLHTLDQWQALLLFFKGQCPCCKKKRKLTLDHVVPLKWGGTHYIDNIQPLCRKCNSTKGDRHDTDYRPKEVRQWADSEMAKVKENVLV